MTRMLREKIHAITFSEELSLFSKGTSTNIRQSANWLKPEKTQLKRTMLQSHINNKELLRRWIEGPISEVHENETGCGKSEE